MLANRPAPHRLQRRAASERWREPRPRGGAGRESRPSRRITPMMVCRYDDSRLLLTLQIDHSRIAGLFAAHWGNAEFSEPRPYTAMAIAAQEHDSGWWEWETRPTVNPDGYPPDYIGSIKQLGPDLWLGFMDDGVERAMRKDPYAALIVAMHAEGLCTQGKGLLPYM